MYMNKPQIIVSARNKSVPTAPRLVVSGEVSDCIQRCARWIDRQHEGDTIQITLN